MRILLDVDGVIADFVGGLIRGSRPALQAYNVSVPIVEDFITLEVKDSPHFTLLQQRVFAVTMNLPGFVEKLDMCKGAYSLLSKLSPGNELVHVTKPHRASPTWVYERTRWLEQVHGYVYLPPPKIVHTGHKELIPGDVLIEDNPVNLAKWMDVYMGGTGILVERPWNKGTKAQAGGNLHIVQSLQEIPPLLGL